MAVLMAMKDPIGCKGDSMAWYDTHQDLITDYMMIEQNISKPEELLSWRDCEPKFKPIHLQAYRNDYKDGDYDYFFSLHSAKYPLSNLVFDKDVTALVYGNPKASATKIRRQLCAVLNDWWLTHPEHHSPKTREKNMSEFDIIKIEETSNGAAYATLKNGDELAIASNGVARYNGSLYQNYSEILNIVTVETVFKSMALEISQIKRESV